MRFTAEEHARYGRQMVLAEVGARGQAAWRDAQAEAGDLVEALYLAAAGIGRLRVTDEATATRVRRVNPLVTVTVGAPVIGGDVESSALRALTTLCRILLDVAAVE